MKTNIEIWNKGQLVHSIYNLAVAVNNVVQDKRLWELAKKAWEIYEELTNESHK